MTTLELEMRFLGQRFDEHIRLSDRNHEDTVKLLEKLDQRDDELEDRQDAADRRQERLLGGVAVVVGVSAVIGPIVAKAVAAALGIPS